MKPLTRDEMKQIKGGIIEGVTKIVVHGKGLDHLAQPLQVLQVHVQELSVIRNRYLIIIMHVPKI